MSKVILGGSYCKNRFLIDNNSFFAFNHMFRNRAGWYKWLEKNVRLQERF